MSSGIRDLERINSRQLETAKRRHDREIKNIENAHQNYKADLQKAHAGEVVDLQDQNRRQIDQEATKKEKILNEMRTHLQQTSELTDKQLKDLKVTSEAEKAKIVTKLSDERERQISEHELYLEELNDRYTTASRDVNLEGKKRVDDMTREMGEAHRESEAFHQNKINKQTEEFTTRFNTDTRNYKKLKDDQDGQFKKERMATNTRQQTEMAKMTEVHNTEMEKRDTTYRKGLKEQDGFFEKKYKDNLDSNNANLKTLEDTHQKVVSNLKSSLTQEITQTVSKMDDPFYKFEALKPKMTQYPDRVEIQVDVPEHSKQDLRLTFNNKEAVLSYNRRYVDANKTFDGVINKINKVESFTTRLATDAQLDPKSVKSSYENGTMTYIVKKA